MSKVIRVRYEKGVLKPLEPINLEEGVELHIALLTIGKQEKRNRKRIVEKYKGFMGSASKKEIDELLLEAEFEGL